MLDWIVAGIPRTYSAVFLCLQLRFLSVVPGLELCAFNVLWPLLVLRFCTSFYRWDVNMYIDL